MNTDNVYVVIQDDYYLEVGGQNQGNITFHLVDYIDENHIRMYKKQVKIGRNSDIKEMFIFQNNSQLFEFIKQKDNCNIDFIKKQLTFKLSFIGVQFSKILYFSLQLEPELVSEMQQLKWANKVLKKKLKLAASLSSKRLEIQKQNQKCEKLIKQEPFIIEISEDRSELQEEIQKQVIQQKIKKNPVKSKLFKRKGPQSGLNIVDKNQEEAKALQKTKMIQKFIKSDFMQKILKKHSNKIQRQLGKQKQSKPQTRLQSQVQALMPKPTKTQTETQISKGEASLSLKDRINQRKNIDENKRTQSDKFKVKKIGNKFRFDFQGGDYYFGEIKNEIYNGQGFYYSTVFGTFDGEWKDGKANGQGVSIDRQGNKSLGIYKNDKRYGHGIDEFANGDRYEGEFYEDLKHGHGKYIYKEGNRYEGEWKNNMAEGEGVEYYKDGSFYKGYWKQDLKDGKGQFHRNGKIIKQTWAMGNLIQSNICEQDRTLKQQQKAV